MREIKFRGKRTDNGEWVYGSFYKGHRLDTTAPLWELRIFWNIITTEGVIYEVSHKSVGQFTGILDKNKKEIWEKDVVYIAGVGNREVIFDKGGFGYLDELGVFQYLGDDMEGDIENVVSKKLLGND